jgi:hypothetical protein
MKSATMVDQLQVVIKPPIASCHSFGVNAFKQGLHTFALSLSLFSE